VTALVVLVTTPNGKTSEKLSKGLVNAKLAACVNRLPGLKSRYWWKGKVETAREELLLIKTTRSKIPALTKWVKSHHPYDLCEIIAIPVVAGSKPYLEWISGSIH